MRALEVEMLFRSGYYKVGRFKEVPIFIHWSAPVVALWWSGFRFAPGFWLGFIFLILVHELGHAVVAKLCGMRVHSVEVHGLGGLCSTSGNPTAMQRAKIAWGGVWAQGLLLVATLVVFFVSGGPRTSFGRQLEYVFVDVSLWIAVINLIPVPPLDGHEAWKAVPILYERFKFWRGLRSETHYEYKKRPPGDAQWPKDEGQTEVSEEQEELFDRMLDDIQHHRHGD